VKSLKGTMFHIDEKNVLDLNEISSIIDCYNKNTCLGICTIVKDYKFLLEVMGLIGYIEEDMVYNIDRFVIHLTEEVILYHDAESVTIDKKKFLSQYLNDIWMVTYLCSKVNVEAIKLAFMKLPMIIELSAYDFTKDLLIGGSNHETDYADIVVRLSDDSIKKVGDEIEKRLKRTINKYNN